MVYQLISQNGDSIAVPQLVFSSLPRADENCVRVALYILQTGCTDPRTIAHDLGLKSVPAAERTLQWWAGAGLLRKERGALPEEAAAAQKPDLLTVLCDPKIAALMQHAQVCFGGTLSDNDSRRLVALYTADGYPVDMILLCMSHMHGRPQGMTFAGLKAELARWRKNGVTGGEDAERYLAQQEKRVGFEQQTAVLLGLNATEFTPGERRSTWRWRENWGFGEDMIVEAAHYLPAEKTVWALNDLLKAWHLKGWMRVADVRGSAVFGSNIRADAPSPAAAQSGSAQNNLMRNLNRPLKLKRED